MSVGAPLQRRGIGGRVGAVRSLVSLTLAGLVAAAPVACTPRSGPPPSAAAARDPSDAAIRALVDKRCASNGGHALVVGVIDADGRRRVFGHTAGGRTFDGRTLFEIGSITKVYTATLLADMVERGEVKLDDPVQKYLPEGVKMPLRGGQPVTLLELATHTSGLPRMPSNFAPRDPANPYADYTAKELYAYLAGLELPAVAAREAAYSNLGVGLLGHALARRAGRSYEELVRTRILSPLGMTSTAIALSPELRARLAPGHDAEGKPVRNWDLDVLAGAGGLRSTVDDQLRFLAANLDPPLAGTLGKALARVLVPRRPTERPDTEVALGWHVTRRGSREIVAHNGGTGGYRSYVGFDRGARRAVVVLSASLKDIDDLGLHLLDATAPLAVPPADRQEVSVRPERLDRFTGVYELAPHMRLTVTRQGDGLAAQVSGQPRVRLFAESPTKFFVKEVDAQVTFVEGVAGKVHELVLHGSGSDMRGKRISDVPAPRRKVSVDAKLLDSYVGEYRLSPTFSITVTRDGAGLAVQATDQPRFPIFAEAPTEFFLGAVDAQISFSRDAAGKVTGLVLHQDGADSQGRKIK
jgi:serine-type D-Ala-D-Ala carboxypeptidase/endopeptidase